MRFQSILDPAGAQAVRIHSHWLLFWYVLLAIYIIVGGFYLYILFRSRRASPMAVADRPHALDVRLGKYVALATGITALILVGLLVSAAIVGTSIGAYGPKPDMQVEVAGRQWWWQVRYLNDDPSKILTTANEIHIPTGRKVMLKLSSMDVIHSFWVPNLSGKRDLIPGRANSIVIEADRPGIYRGQCAEFCGLQHANMGLYVVAEDPGHFSEWITNQLRPAPEPPDPSAKRGRQVFLNAPCIICHTIRGTPAFGQVGPDLTHIGSRRAIGAGAAPNTPGHLGGWIVDSQSIKPGNRMPSIPLPAGDVQPLIAYLESLK